FKTSSEAEDGISSQRQFSMLHLLVTSSSLVSGTTVVA
ncbi:hypothetical protein A2U01_0110787, partial [Trifolium medium]|nr:hypothetical protein [Trifolium medium]